MGINYQSQLVIAGCLNHQYYHPLYEYIIYTFHKTNSSSLKNSTWEDDPASFPRIRIETSSHARSADEEAGA